MRVAGGRFKGKLLRMPKGAKIRPSSQKVKQALFNILAEGISGASFLELFAGSGAVGIEALSRGAARVVFVENNRLYLKGIQDNLKTIGAARGRDFEALPLAAEEAIAALAQKKEQFDLIFLDPPYHQDKLKNCLIKLTQYDILRPHSCVIAEHNKRLTLPEQLGKLKLMFTKSYGDSALSCYQKELQ